MKKIVRRIAVVVGAVAVSIGLLGATAAPSEAAMSQRTSDTQWG
jgi:hypothetical protein